MRLAVAFFVAYGLNTTLHECAHALMAHLLGLPATLFHFYVNIDYSRADTRDRVLCAIAGPILSLGLGAGFWLLYRKFQTRPEALHFLYVSVLGISIFLGNVFSTGLVAGDFGTAAAELNVSRGARVAATLAGGLLLAAFLYRTGPELLRWTPPERSRLGSAVQAIVLPVAMGMALVVAVFLPLPRAFVQDWAASSSFWVFAVAGVFRARRTEAAEGAGDPRVRAVDVLAAVGVAAAVRFLAQGIRL